jgi:5-hydroxyisourate hydrolase
MGRLAASVLDSVNGRPAAGVRIELYRIDSGSRVRVAATQTNAIGRTEPALMEGDSFRTGRYELEFALAEYFATQGTPQADPPFLQAAVLRIELSEPDGDYRVPLIASPWGFNTYRGS